MAASDYFNDDLLCALIDLKKINHLISFFYDIRGFFGIYQETQRGWFTKTDSFKFRDQKYERFCGKECLDIFCISEENENL